MKKLNLPILKDIPEPPPRPLSAREYAEFVAAGLRLLDPAARERLRQEAIRQGPKVRFVA